MKAMLLAVALLAFAPAMAHAWAPVDDRPANNPLVERLLPVAYGFWQARNVTPCPRQQLDVRLGADLSGGMSWEESEDRTPLGGCTVWLRSGLVASAQNRRPGSDAAIYLCRIITHALGHTAGLSDSMHGVMSSTATFVEGTPFPCRQWAKGLRRR